MLKVQSTIRNARWKRRQAKVNKKGDWMTKKDPGEVVRGNFPVIYGGHQTGNRGGPRGLLLWFILELALADII